MTCFWIFGHDWTPWRYFGIGRTMQERQCKRCGRGQSRFS